MPLFAEDVARGVHLEALHPLVHSGQHVMGRAVDRRTDDPRRCVMRQAFCCLNLTLRVVQHVMGAPEYGDRRSSGAGGTALGPLVGLPRSFEWVITRAIEGPVCLLGAQPCLSLGLAAELVLRPRGFSGSRHSDGRPTSVRHAELEARLRCPNHSRLLSGAVDILAGHFNALPDRHPAGHLPRA